MTAELVSVVGAPGGLPGQLLDQSYPLPPGLSYEEWQNVGLSLRFMHRNINWWLGDWLAYGEAAYGEDAYQACLDGLSALMGREAESLGQCAWVAARFPPRARVPALSWSHHRAVLLEGLAPEDGAALLTTAAAENWPVKQLAAEAAARKGALDAETLRQESAAAREVAGPWLPGAGDLTEEARAACNSYTAGAGVPPEAAARIWARCLFWAGVKDAFTRWEE